MQPPLNCPQCNSISLLRVLCNARFLAELGDELNPLAGVVSYRCLNGHIFMVFSSESAEEPALMIEYLTSEPVLLSVDNDETLSPVSEDERSCQKLINALPDAVLVHSENKIVFANPFCQHLMGADSGSELLGRDISEFIDEAYLSAIRNRIQDCYTSGQASLAMECVLVASDGSSVDVEAAGVPLFWKGAPAIGVVLRDISARKQAESSQQEWQQRLELAQRSGLRIGLWDWNMAANTVLWSDETCRQFGYTQETFLGGVQDAVARIHPEDVGGVRQAILKVQTGGGEYAAQYRVVRPDGTTCWLDARGVMVRNGSHHMIGISIDITERRNLEEQFRQAQKMEAIGLLAGGISHDFNNLLAVILANAELLLVSAQPDAQERHVKEIQRATSRASQSIRQLLAFSRKQVLHPTVLNINSIIRDVAQILQRLIGEDLQIVMDLTSNLSSIRADGGQIEQILMNLATNARDAMPYGGKITIQTRNTNTVPDSLTECGVPTDEYIRLSVSDTGMGMSEEVKSRIFEPFFTTKSKGRGTGLGMAAVYAAIQQAGGSISVSSGLGRGSTFDIYFPSTKEIAPSWKPNLMPQRAYPRGHETILLLEDEEPLRRVTAELLAASGFIVMQAGRGDHAIDLATQHDGAIDLVISDVVLPDVSGPTAVKKIRELHPETKALYMSGYADVPVIQQIVTEGAIFIQKPISGQHLRRTIDNILHPSTLDSQ